MKKIEKVTLIGMGSMGSFFAPGLFRSLGENFRIMASGARKERLTSNGVTINGVNYHFPVITPDSEDGPSDLIIIAVKSYSLGQAMEDIRGQVGPDTILMPVLNGVDSEKELADVYGAENVLYAFMRISINMQNGKTDYDPKGGSVHFGEAHNDPGCLSEKVRAVKSLFDQSDIQYIIDEDMIHGMWFKFACNVAENLTCAMFDIPFGAFRDSDNANYFRRSAMAEVFRVADRLGIPLTREDFEEQEVTIRTLPYNNKPSTALDLENKKHTEVDMFAGTVVRLGAETGVPTPVCEMFLHGIHLLEERNDGLLSPDHR